MGQQSLPQLQMDRDDLEHLPEVQIAEGYRLRIYQRGDEAAWCRLMGECIGGHYDEAECRSSLTETPNFAPEDMFFAEYDGEIVGSACAHRGADTPEGVGYVHMVAVTPAHRGHRLGHTVTNAVLWRFRELGYGAATLRTDDFRLPAIRIYLELGFHPTMTHESHAARWEAVLEELSSGPRAHPSS